MSQHITILTGASRGMGLAMAEQLLAAGHDLLCISRKQNDALGLRSIAGRAPAASNGRRIWPAPKWLRRNWKPGWRRVTPGPSPRSR